MADDALKVLGKGFRLGAVYRHDNGRDESFAEPLKVAERRVAGGVTLAHRDVALHQPVEEQFGFLLFEVAIP